MKKEYSIQFKDDYKKGSEKRVAICDMDDNIIGHVNRTNSSIWDRVKKYFDNDEYSYANVKLTDAQGDKKVEMKSHDLGVTTLWMGKSYSEEQMSEFELEYKSSDKMLLKNFEYRCDGLKCEIKGNKMVVEPSFYDDRGNLLAQCKDDLLQNKLNIQIYSDKIDEYKIIAICFTIFCL